MQNIRVEEFKNRLTDVIKDYVSTVEEEFRHLWNSWEIDIANREVHEVIGAIIARQISIATHFVISTNNWNHEIAPIILRSMADNYINLAWILKDPLERSRKFIVYGLGQEKLAMELRKNQLKEEMLDFENDLGVKTSKQWIDVQQYDFLTSVDVGRWSKKSVHDMAVEADCKDFYNYVYQPFSSATHNMWNHIGKHNVKISDNPLHRFFLIPFISEKETEFHYPELAAKYVNKCFVAFHDKFKTERYKTIALEVLYLKYEELLDDFNLS